MPETKAAKFVSACVQYMVVIIRMSKKKTFDPKMLQRGFSSGNRKGKKDSNKAVQYNNNNNRKKGVI